MGLSNVSGVLSRYFVIGFFVPVFAALIVYSQAVSSDLLPPVYRENSPGTQIAILGGAALMTGLVLLGLNYPIMRIYEGYPLMKIASWASAPQRRQPVGLLRKFVERFVFHMITVQANRRAELRTVRDESADESTQAVAAWRLDSRYPRRRRDLLPTAYGNVVRAFELHSSHRWGLDAIAAQPRISALMSSQELAIETDARSEAAFFVNLSLLSLLLAAACLIDLLVFRSGSLPEILALAAPLLTAWMFYRASVGAAERWGSTVRASIDLHRLEFYEKLGVTSPTTFSAERLVIGPAVSRCLLHGNRLPDELRAAPTTTKEPR
jgi:hypothetical protein